MKFKTLNGDIKPIEKDIYKEAFIVLSDYRDIGQTYSTEWTDAEIVEDLMRDFYAYHYEEGDEIREVYIKKVTRWEFMD